MDSVTVALNECEVSDEEILRKFSFDHSKVQAFTELVYRDQKRIYYFIRRMVIDHEDADDLTQEVFMKVWTHLGSFKGESRIIYWIYRIAVNHVYTFLQKKKKKYSWSSLNDMHHELINKLYADKYIDANTIQAKLQEAILALPEKQRLVFQLRYYDELPYEAMSRITDTSVGALKASFHKAVKKVESFMLKNQ